MPILILLLLLLILFIVLYRRMKHKRNVDEQAEEIYLREKLSAFHKDEMEVKRSQISLYETLGEGAFGIVRKGKLMPHSIDVAVKMVKSGSVLWSMVHSRVLCIRISLLHVFCFSSV